MKNYHPVVGILLQRFGITQESIKPLREQLIAYREDSNGLKEMLIKHNITSEVVFQKAIAKYLELEYRDNFDDIKILKEFTEFIL